MSADSKSDEDYHTRCPCGEQNIPGNSHVLCEHCKVWQHNICVALPEPGSSFDDELRKLKYFCERCKPEDHPRFAAGSTTGTPLETAAQAREMQLLQTTNVAIRNGIRKHAWLVNEIMAIVQREYLELSHFWSLACTADRPAFVPDITVHPKSAAWNEFKNTIGRSVRIITEHATIADLEALRTRLVLSWYENFLPMDDYEIPISKPVPRQVYNVEGSAKGMLIPEFRDGYTRFFKFTKAVWAARNLVSGADNAVMAKIVDACTAQEIMDLKTYFDL